VSEHRVVDARCARDAVAGVALANDVGSLAVRALFTQAEGFSGCEVGAVGINLLDIVHGELVAVRRCQKRRDNDKGNAYVDTLLAAEMLSQ
jgi:hypothetical protein